MVESPPRAATPQVSLLSSVPLTEPPVVDATKARRPEIVMLWTGVVNWPSGVQPGRLKIGSPSSSSSTTWQLMLVGFWLPEEWHEARLTFVLAVRQLYAIVTPFDVITVTRSRSIEQPPAVFSIAVPLGT